MNMLSKTTPGPLKEDSRCRNLYGRKCVICKRRQTTGSNLHFFKLPLEPSRCRLWLQAIGDEDLVYLPIEKLHQVKYVCDSHFSPKDFSNSRNRIKQSAVPTLNLPLNRIPDHFFKHFPYHVHPDRVKRGTRAKHVLQVITNKEYMDTPISSPTDQQMESCDITGEGLSAPSNVETSHEHIQTCTQKTKAMASVSTAAAVVSPLMDHNYSLATKSTNVLNADSHKEQVKGLLEANLPLPSQRSTTRLLNSVPIEPGINKAVLESLKEKVSNMSDRDKFCCILFDEMSLKKQLFYNEGTDKVEGYVDWGSQERTNKIADRVLVFMIQGLAKKYKQPIAYYFGQRTISSAKLSVIIKEIIVTVNGAGLKVINTVCDHGPTNVGALTLLRQASPECQDTNYFFINNKKIYIIFDVPHLFKSIRNNFFNAKEMSYDGKTAKWAHLIEAEAINKNFLNFQKIRQTIVHPTCKIKMKVKYAAHALSNTMSAVLKMLAWKENDKSTLQTAEVIEDMDKLFDFTNGPKSNNDIKKGLRVNVSTKTNHVNEWKNFFKKIGLLKFKKKDSKLMLRNVRCINGYKTTLKSLNDIWSLLQKEKFPYLNLRQLNQDSLENLLGVIRRHDTDNNPTCTLFKAALKSFLVSGWTSPHSSRGSNCEADGNKLLFNYRTTKNNQASVREQKLNYYEASGDIIGPELSLPEYDDIVDDISFTSSEEQPIVFVSCFVAKKLLNIAKDCRYCKKCLINENPDGDDMYQCISLKEWWVEKKSLTYPSKKLCSVVKAAMHIFVEFFSHNLFESNIRERCKIQFMANINIKWFLCSLHPGIPLELFNILAILFISKECIIQNNKLFLLEN